MGRMKLVEEAPAASTPLDDERGPRAGGGPAHKGDNAGGGPAHKGDNTGGGPAHKGESAGGGPAHKGGGFGGLADIEAAAMAAPGGRKSRGGGLAEERPARPPREPVPIEPALVLDCFATGILAPEDHGITSASPAMPTASPAMPTGPRGRRASG